MSKKERKALRRAQHEEFKDSVRDNSFQEWHWSCSYCRRPFHDLIAGLQAHACLF